MLSLWTSALICCVIFASQASAGNYIITLDCGNETECSKILTAIESNLSEQLATSTNETNNVTILDLNECDRIKSVCSKDATCTNMFRSYKCKCKPGFFDDDLLRPGINCSDVNECSNSLLNNCSLDAKCQNTPGGFSCTCNTGFADLAFSNGTNCTDINECSDPLLHKCSRNASCVNLPGNYSCACAVGFQDNDPTTPGTNCSDVNECNNTKACPSNSNCSNTQGSYSCACNPGYTIVANASDSVACYDLDECSNSSLNNCTTSQMCVNTEGTYFCNDVTTTQTKATTAVTTNPPAVTTGTTAGTTASTAVTTASVAVTTPSEPTTNASIAATTAQQTTAVSTTAETTTSPITSPSVTSEIGTTAFQSTANWVTNLTLISKNVTSSNTAPPLLTTNSITTINPMTSSITSSSVVTNASMTTETATKYTSTPSHASTDTVTSGVTTHDVTTPSVLPSDVTSLPADTTPPTTAGSTVASTTSTPATTDNKATTAAGTTATGSATTSTSITAAYEATTNADTATSNILTTASTNSATTQAIDTSTNTTSKATTSESTTQLTLTTTATTSDAITTSPSTTSPSTTSPSTTSPSTTSPSTTSPSTTSPSTTSPSTTSPSTTSPSTTSPSTTSPSTTSPGTTATTQISTTSVQPSTNAATTSTTQSPNLPPSINENITAENIENGSKLYSLEAVTYIETMKENFTSGEAMAIVANLEKLVVPGGGIPVNENVATSVLEVIDAFGASSGDFSSDVTSSLTSLTDTLLSNMQLVGRSFELNLPTFSVGAKDLTGTQTKPIAFSLGSGFEDSTNSNASIELPNDILSNADKQQRISFSGFTNARLFPSPGVTTITSPDFMFGGTTGSVVNSAVMGSTVANTTVRNRENPIRIALPAIVSSIPTVERSNGTRVLRSVFNPRCAFHDVTMNGGLGGWSREGCVTVATSSVEGGVTCECNHLTSFAVLMSVEESSHDDVLHIMTFVGCAFSITGLVITIVTYTLFRQFRTHKSKRILVHFCLSLFGVSVTYLLGIATHLPSNQEQCIAAGFFMHFFTTSTFAWMFIEVFDMYLMFVKVMNVGRHHYVRKACLFGWGFPALLASCTLGAHFALVGNYPGDEEMRMYPTYRSTVACWLNQRALLWALILPMAILMFVNIVLFSFVLYHVTCKRANTMQQSGNNNMRRNSLKEVKASHHVINATAIILLTGPTWIIGFLINIDPVEDGVLRRILSYIFVIFNAFQGLWVFLIFTVRPKSVRQRWKSLLCEKGGLQSVSRASVSWGKQSSRNTGSVSTRSHHNLKQNVSFDQRRISALSSNTGVTLVRHSVDHGQGAGKSPRPQPASQRSYDKSATLPSSDKSPVVSYRYSRETSKVDHDVTNDEVTNSNVIMDDVNKPDVTTDDVTEPEVVTEDVYAPVKKKNKVSPEDKELSRSDSDVTRTNIDLETGSDVGLVQSEESGDFEAARN